MAVTMPSDLFLPQVALSYGRQAFNDSLQIWNNVVSYDANAPIQLVNNPFTVMDQYLQQPRLKRLGAGLVTTRDLTSNSTVTPLKFTSANDIGVKLNRKIGSVEWTYDAARLAGLGMSDAQRAQFISAEFGRQTGEELARNLQNSIVASLIGMVEAMSGTPHTQSVWVSSGSKVNLSPAVLTNALNGMDDARDMIAAWIVHATPHNDYYTDAINRNFTGVGDRALGGNETITYLGRPRAMASAALLRTTPGGFAKYKTLGLGRGALQVYFALPLTMYDPFVDTSRETVTVRYRGDVDIELAPRGFQWNSGAGGANPTDAALSTTSNWTNTYTSHKEVLIVEAVTNSSVD